MSDKTFGRVVIAVCLVVLLVLALTSCAAIPPEKKSAIPGVTCESFRTLAAKDAYAAGHGYRAGRDMRCIVHHREHGEVERHRCDVGMIEA